MDTVVFIGHSEVYKIDEIKLKETIRETILQGAKFFLNGGMGDFDYICARKMLELKKEYPDIQCELVIPYLTFKPRSMDCFDSSVYPDGLEKYHFKSAIPARNKWMIDHSQLAICYVDHGWGGAAQSYEYAKKKKIRIINLGSYE